MRCNKCGTETDGKFCPNCGAPMDQQPATVVNYGPEIENNRKPQKAKKSIFKKWWFWILVVIVLAIIGSGIGGSKGDENSAQSSGGQTSSKDTTQQAQNGNLDSVTKEYTLSAGIYTAGIDIPAGKCDVTAVSGNGNIMSSNMYSGGINEMFGVKEDTGLYSQSFNGLSLPNDEALTIYGNLTVKLTYTSVKSDIKERNYNEQNAITLSNGNYTAGTDFPVGVYKIVAVSGDGNISSSNLFSGGVNEMFGVKDCYGLYTQEFNNANFESGVDLSISGGVTIKLIPAD